MSKALIFGVIVIVVIVVTFLVLSRPSVAPTENNAPFSITGMMKLISPAFGEGEMIPSEYTCDGVNLSPTLNIEGAPADVKSFVLILDDPDSPRGAFTHWLIWNINLVTTAIEKGSVPAGAIQGRNDFGKVGYGGPCPGSGTHRYIFTLYALDITLNLPSGASLAQLKALLQGHIIEQITLTGKYQRGR